MSKLPYGHPEVEKGVGFGAPAHPACASLADRDGARARHVEEEAVARGRVRERNGDEELALVEPDSLAVALKRHDHLLVALYGAAATSKRSTQQNRGKPR